MLPPLFEDPLLDGWTGGVVKDGMDGLLLESGGDVTAEVGRDFLPAEPVERTLGSGGKDGSPPPAGDASPGRMAIPPYTEASGRRPRRGLCDSGSSFTVLPPDVGRRRAANEPWPCASPVPLFRVDEEGEDSVRGRDGEAEGGGVSPDPRVRREACATTLAGPLRGLTDSADRLLSGRILLCELSSLDMRKQAGGRRFTA